MKLPKIRKGLRAITHQSRKHKSLYKSNRSTPNLVTDHDIELSDPVENEVDKGEREPEQEPDESRVVVLNGILAELESKGLKEHLNPIGDISPKAKSNVDQAVKFLAKFLCFLFFTLCKGEAFYQGDILTRWYLQMFRVEHDSLTKFCKEQDQAAPKTMLSYLSTITKLTQ